MLYTNIQTIEDEKLKGLLEKVVFIKKELDVDLTEDMKCFADRICKLSGKSIISKEWVVFLKLTKLSGWGKRNDGDAWDKILQNIVKLLRDKARICNRFDGILVLEVSGITKLHTSMISHLTEFLTELQEHCHVVLTYTDIEEDDYDLMNTKELLWSQLSICEMPIKSISNDLYEQMLWEEFPGLQTKLMKNVKNELLTYIENISQKNKGFSQYQYLLNLLYPCHECSNKEHLNNLVMEALQKCETGQNMMNRATIGFAK